MRKIIEETTLYSFNELSEKAKERVKEWYLERRDSREFEELCNLEERFPNSDLKLQFSLTYCQGDGLNIYGKLYVIDLRNVISIPDFINDNDYIEFQYNNRYCYSKKFLQKKHINEEVEDFLYKNGFVIEKITEKQYEKLESFLLKVFELFEGIENELEDFGYNYFYDVDEEELEDYCNSNELEFTEDGVLF